MKEIDTRECKFVFYSDPKHEEDKDIHIVVELITYKDGTKEKKLTTIEDFKRSFWITKQAYRKHKQKKECELLDRLIEYKSTQKDLGRNINRILGGGRFRGDNTLFNARNSPYVYGISVDTRAIIKKAYMDKYPTVIPSLEVAAYDIEVDIDTDEIVIISVAMQDKIATFIKKSVIDKTDKPIDQLNYLFTKYIPKTDITEHIKREYYICNTELDLVKDSINKAHEWKPDILAVWNVKYDMGKLLGVCKKFEVDPKDIFSDPSLKKEYRFFHAKWGIEKKVTASGVVQPKGPEEQWHVFEAPAYFYWLDAMSTYNFVRSGSKKVPGGYSLNNILETELGTKYKKLKFKEDDNIIDGVDWHRHMLSKRPLEYIVYNQWDVISMLELDNNIKDICVSLPTLSMYSSFNIFHKGPTTIADHLHFLYLSYGKVLGCPPSKKTEDDELLGRDGWILTLPIDRIKERTSKYLDQDNLMAGIFLHTYDSDQVSGYPSNTIACNVSRETTLSELMDIEGIEKDEFKKQNMNLFYGKVNHLEYGQTMFNLPNLYDLGWN